MIELKNISLSFGEKQIFKDFSCAINDEGVVLIMGESGIGKTTLLRLIAGLIKPDGGTVSGTEGRKISFIFQESRLLAGRTVLKNVSLVSDSHLAERELCALGLKNELHTVVDKLSGGQKQRVSIARALAYSKDIVLCDEPFWGLDEDNRLLAIEQLKRARLAIIVTHSAEDIKAFPGCRLIQI